MKLLKRPRSNEATFGKARDRARKMASADLEGAAWAHLQYIGEYVSAWRRSGGDRSTMIAALEEAEMNALSLIEIFRELRSRAASL